MLGIYEPSREAWVLDFWEYYMEAAGVDELDIELGDEPEDCEVD